MILTVDLVMAANPFRSTTDPSARLKEEVAVEIQEGKNILFEHCTAYSRAKAAESVHDEFVVVKSEEWSSPENNTISQRESTSSSQQLVLSPNFSTTLVSIHAKISSVTPAETRRMALSNSSIWLSQLYIAWASTATSKELTVALGQPKSFHHTAVQLELQRHQRGFATFANLWLLFKSDSSVFARINGQPAFFKVLSTSREVDEAGKSGPWSIIVWGLYFDGYLLRRKARCFNIHEFHAERSIQKLPLKPVEYLQDQDGTIDNFTTRGRQYYDLVCNVPLTRGYDGLLNGDKRARYVGDAVIDPDGYLKDSSFMNQPSGNFEVLFDAQNTGDNFGVPIRDPTNFGSSPYAKLDDQECSNLTPLQDQEYLLLPGQIQGYALGRKQWRLFDVASFTRLDNDDRPWENLVVDQRDLQLIQSLVSQLQGSSSFSRTANLFTGEGETHVILLHGPPGVGK